ncbi:MAG: Hsp20/alpha crystallin family protein [Candidatus Eisenbacteria bacterium]|uniref:Hsp20/alpha crystallin family protein n=1 Tax=Eiseniibacteriota bacterium TaxID=2212470 RepID=A0A538TPD9_UNCEI|nr:MAG: Hsp20/alpha crystallin family protein [Candidatus Eisenbacteria bacterium]
MNTLIRWPIREISSVQDEMNKVFSDVFGRRWLTEEGGKAVVWQPPVDIVEQPDRYVVHVELPGMKLEDIKITLEDNQLVIRGEKTRTEEQQNAAYHRLERVHGTFERSFTLTQAGKSDKIAAAYRDGVLEVTVPKAEEAKAREIPIKVAH